MVEWLELATKGNRCFDNKQWQDAETYYNNALRIVTQESPWLYHDRDALFAWLACYHNLASLYQSLNKRIQARFYLDAPLEILEKGLGELSPSDDFFITLLKAYQVGLIELCKFEQALPINILQNQTEDE